MLHREVIDSAATLRHEMQAWRQRLRSEILDGVWRLRHEMVQQHGQRLKLCFNLWVGQSLVIVVGALAK